MVFFQRTARWGKKPEAFVGKNKEDRNRKYDWLGSWSQPCVGRVGLVLGDRLSFLLRSSICKGKKALFSLPQAEVAPSWA